MTRKLAFATLQSGGHVYFTPKSASFLESNAENEGCCLVMNSGSVLYIEEGARLMIERIWPEDQKAWELQQTLRPQVPGKK